MRGEHDLTTVRSLSTMLSAAIGIDDADLVVDASEVTFLDASTLGVLTRAQSFLHEHARSLLVRSPSTCVRRILDICDLTMLAEATEAGTTADHPVTVGALETWVSVPATTPDPRRSPLPSEEPLSREVEFDPTPPRP